jgi:hypothetical protein
MTIEAGMCMKTNKKGVECPKYYRTYYVKITRILQKIADSDVQFAANDKKFCDLVI